MSRHRDYSLQRFLTTKEAGMDALTAFGLFAVTAMLVCHALESRSHWFILAFAVRAPWKRFTVSCKALGIWAGVAGWRWLCTG
jgi:hypothetical protein